MTTASMNGSSTPTASAGETTAERPAVAPAGRPATAPARQPTLRVAGLDELIGGHPEALRALYLGGKLADPAELGHAPRGRLLALEPAREIHFLVRPVVQGLGAGLLPWQGKSFDADGTGANLVMGRPTARFTFETGPSDVDGGPTLVLRYDDPAHRNRWPLRNVRDELRTIGDGLAIGPALFAASASGARKVIVWFGLERAR
jgi:hypothetical protein